MIVHMFLMLYILKRNKTMKKIYKNIDLNNI